MRTHAHSQCIWMKDADANDRGVRDHDHVCRATTRCDIRFNIRCAFRYGVDMFSNVCMILKFSYTVCPDADET